MLLQSIQALFYLVVRETADLNHATDGCRRTLLEKCVVVVVVVVFYGGGGGVGFFCVVPALKFHPDV